MPYMPWTSQIFAAGSVKVSQWQLRMGSCPYLRAKTVKFLAAVIFIVFCYITGDVTCLHHSFIF
jgi:hypothetical protein